MSTMYIIYVNIKKGTCKWTKLFLVIAQIYVFFHLQLEYDEILPISTAQQWLGPLGHLVVF